MGLVVIHRHGAFALMDWEVHVRASSLKVSFLQSYLVVLLSRRRLAVGFGNVSTSANSQSSINLPPPARTGCGLRYPATRPAGAPPDARSSSVRCHPARDTIFPPRTAGRMCEFFGPGNGAQKMSTHATGGRSRLSVPATPETIAKSQD